MEQSDVKAKNLQPFKELIADNIVAHELNFHSFISEFSCCKDIFISLVLRQLSYFPSVISLKCDFGQVFAFSGSNIFLHKLLVELEK